VIRGAVRAVNAKKRTKNTELFGGDFSKISFILSKLASTNVLMGSNVYNFGCIIAQSVQLANKQNSAPISKDF
jgi:hypothetical protein